jgi:VIT1/CCC1 family predicted Fe2+/Mn2+ transporter
VAWGLIDGGMFLMGSLLERARNTNAVAAVQGSADEASALAAVERAMNGTLASYASPAERETVARVILGVVRRVPLGRTRIRREDLLGAAASCALVVVSTVPAAVPFLFIDRAWNALRVSNLLLLAMIFVVGYRWGFHAQARPWVTGLAFLVVGTTMVAVAIALGG